MSTVRPASSQRENAHSTNDRLVIFLNILGDFSGDYPSGGEALNGINIVGDYEYNGEWVCAEDEYGPKYAITAAREDPNPVIALCPLVFNFGNIDKGYDGVDAVTCDSVKADGNKLSWRMDTLAATLLHEYTHTRKLLPNRSGFTPLTMRTCSTTHDSIE